MTTTGAYDQYDDDSLPDVDSANADISFVWPARAKSEDFVYIVGSNLVILDENVDKGIDYVRFVVNGHNHDVDGDEVDIIGSMVIRCQLPAFGGDSGPATVSIVFEGASPGSPSEAGLLQIGG